MKAKIGGETDTKYIVNLNGRKFLKSKEMRLKKRRTVRKKLYLPEKKWRFPDIAYMMMFLLKMCWN